MRRLSAADIVHLWEVGRGESPAARAVSVLSRACPERERSELERLPLGARDRLLLEARAATVGGVLEANARCPQCDETVEFTLDVAALCDGLDGGDAAVGRTVEVDGYTVSYRPLDSTDMDAAAGCVEPAEARRILVDRCVVSAELDGEPVETSALPAEALDRLSRALSASDPGAETVLALDCPECGAAWLADLDPAGFFWRELASRARGLLDEVDALARAYGWSEAEILALTPERRGAYMERVL